MTVLLILFTEIFSTSILSLRNYFLKIEKQINNNSLVPDEHF